MYQVLFFLPVSARYQGIMSPSCLHIQWNPSKPDSNWQNCTVLHSEMSEVHRGLINVYKFMEIYTFGTYGTVLFITSVRC